MLKSTLLAAIFRGPTVPLIQAETGCWPLCVGLHSFWMFPLLSIAFPPNPILCKHHVWKNKYMVLVWRGDHYCPMYWILKCPGSIVMLFKEWCFEFYYRIRCWLDPRCWTKFQSTHEIGATQYRDMLLFSNTIKLYQNYCANI